MSELPLDWCIKRLVTMHFRAQVGHLGGNLSCLPALCALVPRLRSEDRLILSKGHSAGALYVTLAKAGYLPESLLDTFHQDGTTLPGHPPANIFPVIPFATGSLGHGLSLAAGFALSQKLRAKDGHTYCLTSDGEWQEGSTWEALMFACHHRLRNLSILVDHNGLQGFGSTAAVASMDELWRLVAGFDLEVKVLDGHDPKLVTEALNQPQERVRAIFLKTIKGKGLAGLEGTVASHYLPPTEDQVKAIFARLGGAIAS